MKHFYIVSVIILTSCASAYIPSFNETPLFTESKTTIIKSSLTTNSVNIYGAYLFTPNYFISSSLQASYNTIIETDNSSNDIGDSKITLIEFPVPYKHWNSTTKLGYYIDYSKYRIGVQVGFGFGYSKDKGINESQKMNYALYYEPNMQIDISYKIKNVVFGGGVEQNYLFFNQYFFTKSNYQTDYKKYDTYSYSVYNLKPFCFVKSNFPKWNVGGMVGTQFLIPKTDIDFTRFHMSVSVSYAFGNLSK